MRPGFGLLSITNNGSSRGMATGPLQRSGTNFLRWLRQLEYVHEMSREPGAVQLLEVGWLKIPAFWASASIWQQAPRAAHPTHASGSLGLGIPGSPRGRRIEASHRRRDRPAFEGKTNGW